jgi:hypothetical protein
MSMSEPFLPHDPATDDDLAAAEPGPGAPGTPLTEEPDVLPDAEAEPHVEAAPEVPADDPPFRTPQPGESLTVEELEERS